MASYLEMEYPRRILVIEDDEEVQALLKDEFSDEGCRVLQAVNGEEAKRLIEEGMFDLVITDLRFPKGEGLDMLPMVKSRNPEIPVIVITAFGEAKTREEAFQRGADRFLSKPFRTKELKAAVQEAMQKRKGGSER
ncbi:MAG TPA: response regulator [Nitrospiria bacterium]